LPSIILPDPKITPGRLNPQVRQSTINKTMRAWASISHRPIIGITTSGYSARPRLVKHLPAGTCRVSIIASEALGFQLIGPGVNRKTRVLQTQVPASDYSTNTVWTVPLRRGIYRYRADRAVRDQCAPSDRLFSGALSARSTAP
jgi:hypothetical protein